MIIIMKPSATKKQVTSVIDRIKDIGLDVQINQDKEQVVLYCLETREVYRI